MQRNIVLLFDRYSSDSRDLHESFKRAGYDLSVVVIEEDGFLPDDVISVYGSFLGNYKEAEGAAGRPLYFNEVLVPDQWETGGIGKDGKIHHLQEEKGRILFAKHSHKGFVKTVEWFDRRGIVRSKDHYNRYGVVYARTVCSAAGQEINRTWFSVTGQEVIVENCITGNIILNRADGIVKCFRSSLEFVLYFMRESGYGARRIFFNSLSTPFFTAQRFSAPGKEDRLFWQESVGEEVPWNMRLLLQGWSGGRVQIMAQKRQAYDRLAALGVPEDRMHRLGYIYAFQKENRYRPEAFICTSSDQLTQCEELIKGLPQMHFHIAALTMMSPRLMSMGVYENVSLYPLVWIEEIAEFFEKCDFYLDINHGAEVLSSVRQAFLHNNLIFAFEETAHNRDLVAAEHIYAAGDVMKMIADLKEIMADETVLDRHLQVQREAAGCETAESYRRLVIDK